MYEKNRGLKFFKKYFFKKIFNRKSKTNLRKPLSKALLSNLLGLFSPTFYPEGVNSTQMGLSFLLEFKLRLFAGKSEGGKCN